MALRLSSSMALCLLFSLMAVAHCVPLEEADLATNASSAAVTAVPDGEGLVRLPSRDDSIVPDTVARAREVPGEETVKPVAEPDPDRSHPDSNGEEELMASKPFAEGQQSDEKTTEQIDDDEDKDEKEEKKKNHDGDDKEEKEKKKRKKHHDCDGKEKTKKHHQSSDDEEGEEEKTKKQIHRHHHVEEEEMRKRLHHSKNSNGNDSDDEDEQEKKAKRWRKAISWSRFGHGRRSQREEAEKEEVNN